MQMMRGSDMSEVGKRMALRVFIHRYTGDHKPAWAHQEWKDGKPYPLQFADDQDWLANTFFYVTASHRLSELHKTCESHPTWPNNPELRGRYR